METLAGQALPKFIEFSIALTICVAIICALCWALWKLWHSQQAERSASTAALAESNALRLSDARDYATNRQHASEQQRSTLEQLNKVLSKLDATGTSDTQTRKMLLAICEKLNLPLKDFM